MIYSSRLLHKVNVVRLSDGYCRSVGYPVCFCHAQKSMHTVLSVPLKGSPSVTERPLKMCDSMVLLEFMMIQADAAAKVGAVAMKQTV